MGTGAPEWHSYKHAGYILSDSSSKRTSGLADAILISGLQISTGLQASSQGQPCLLTDCLHRARHRKPVCRALPLVWYSEQHPLAGHHPADRWTGGAWVTLGDRQAVVIVGRKALGEFYYVNPSSGLQSL